MARYTGPKWRINRRENATVLGSNEKWKKRPTPPGMHGASRKRASEYSIQFREKQKVKRSYGMLERQFKKFYAIAKKKKGNTGTQLLQLLELRLDNVVYRLKLASTRRQSRQFVSHGLVKVNGKKLDIPSYLTKIGDKIELNNKIITTENFKVMQIERKSEKLLGWLRGDSAGGEVVAEPLRADIDSSIKVQLIIELYSR